MSTSILLLKSGQVVGDVLVNVPVIGREFLLRGSVNDFTSFVYPGTLAFATTRGQHMGDEMIHDYKTSSQ